MSGSGLVAEVAVAAARNTSLEGGGGGGLGGRRGRKGWRVRGGSR